MISSVDAGAPARASPDRRATTRPGSRPVRASMSWPAATRGTSPLRNAMTRGGVHGSGCPTCARRAEGSPRRGCRTAASWCSAASAPGRAEPQSRRSSCSTRDEAAGGRSLTWEHRATASAPWWVTVFTSMFMHGSLLHLAGNMLFLWIFGNNIEDSMGRPRFVVFYLLGGVAALGGQILTDPDATIPTVGASGAIAAVLGGYALLYPRARVITVFI